MPNRRIALRLSARVVILEAIAVIIICCWSITYWLGELNLSPDSTGYIAAANNFVSHGSLYVWANFPSGSMLPIAEPFTEQPPGLPVLLSPFIFLLGDPVLAAMVFQSFAIIAYYFGIYSLLKSLGFGPLLRISSLLVFSFLGPFREIHGYFWTETLFIGVAAGIGALIIHIAQGGLAKWNWVGLFALLFLGSSLRLTGVANIAWIIPFAIRPQALRAMATFFKKKVVAISLTVTGLGLILLSLIRGWLRPEPINNLTPFQLISSTLGILALFTGSLGAYFAARERAVKKSPPSSDSTYLLLGIGVPLAALAPVFLWLMRNRVIYGVFTYSHKPFESFFPGNILIPFRFTWEQVIATRGNLTVASLLMVTFLVIFPLVQSSIAQREKHIALLSVAGAQFVIVWLPSIVSRFNELDSRLLSPAIALGAVACLNGIHTISKVVSNVQMRRLVLMIPLLFLALNKSVVIRSPKIITNGINYPVEKCVWKNIQELGRLQNSTHYYSDRNFNHQVFAQIPQRIFWDTSQLQDPMYLMNLLGTGENPFIIANAGSPESKAINSTIQSSNLAIRATQFYNCPFVLYSLK
jgi:hypothetical protein